MVASIQVIEPTSIPYEPPYDYPRPKHNLQPGKPSKLIWFVLMQVPGQDSMATSDIPQSETKHNTDRKHTLD